MKKNNTTKKRSSVSSSRTYSYVLKSCSSNEIRMSDVVKADGLVDAYCKVLETLDMINEKTVAGTTGKFELETIEVV